MMEQICSMSNWEHGSIWKKHSFQVFLMHLSPGKEKKENLNQSRDMWVFVELIY